MLERSANNREICIVEKEKTIAKKDKTMAKEDNNIVELQIMLQRKV